MAARERMSLRHAIMVQQTDDEFAVNDRITPLNRIAEIVVIVSLFCTLFGSPSADAQGFADNPQYGAPRGPIPIRDSLPFNLLFLQFTPETADVLRSGGNRYDVQLDVINNLLIPDPRLGATVYIHNEYQQLKFAWRRGLDARTELGVFVPIEWRDGGFLDGIISGYHHFFGLPANADDSPAGGDTYPKYESKLQVTDASGHTLVNQGNAFGLGETVVTVKHTLIRTASRSALALRLGLKLPTGNPTMLLGSGSFDEGLMLDARYNLGRDFTVYGNLGYVMLGRATRAPGSRPNTVETLAGLEYHPNHRDSFNVQIDGNGQFVRTGNEVADRSNVTATFGYQRVLNRHSVGFVSFSEGGHIHNFTLPSFSNIAPDFTVSLGMRWLP
jgi:hypothetical protein